MCDQRPTRTGITLLEVLMVLGLTLILGAVGFWALNPFERLKQSRDRVRLADLENVREAVESAISEGVPLASTFGVPSSTIGVGAIRDSGGSGWTRMDLSRSFESLPIDPFNGKTFSDVLGSSVLGEYQFISDGTNYVLRTHLEAEVNKGKYTEDGNENSWYEVGTAPGRSTYFGL